jgi:hypothetical protein
LFCNGENIERERERGRENENGERGKNHIYVLELKFSTTSSSSPAFVPLLLHAWEWRSGNDIGVTQAILNWKWKSFLAYNLLKKNDNCTTGPWGMP